MCSVEKHEVAGQRRLDAGRRGLVIAHLADHDHVGIGAQERAHRRGEGEVDLRLHLHLAQALLRDLDRVLGGPDLHVRGVDVSRARECSVVVLPEPVGPTHEDRSVRLLERSP